MKKTYNFYPLSRDIQSHWLWTDKEPFDKRSAWIDLLLLANYIDTKTIYKEEVIVCKRGDVNLSISFLSERWRWSREKTRRFLKALETDGMLKLKANTHRTVITICDYECFGQKGSKQYGLGYYKGAKEKEEQIEAIVKESVQNILGNKEEE